MIFYFNIKHGVDLGIKLKLPYQIASRSLTPEEALEQLEVAAGLKSKAISRNTEKVSKKVRLETFFKSNALKEQERAVIFKFIKEFNLTGFGKID